MTLNAQSTQPPIPLAYGAETQVMGVLNATPDSFSGDGLAYDVDALVRRGLEQVEQGATILDVGGESTRPGATPVDADDEIRRVVPVVERLAALVQVPISIDTQKATVARAALAAGATILNDISGLRDPDLARAAADAGAWLIVMHNRLERRAERDALGGYYPGKAAEDILAEVADHLAGLVSKAVAAGVSAERIVVDPGLGFGKSPAENLELLRRTNELHHRLAPHPLLVGPSRKSFVGRALGLPPEERLEGTLACVTLAAFAGAEIVRVHDVAPAYRCVRMAMAVREGVLADGV